MTCRKHHSDESISDLPLKTCRKSSDNDQLSAFIAWCQDECLCISPKVCVSTEGSCAKWGMIASEDISQGETLFTVPRSTLLTPSTCSISELLHEESSSLRSSSGWVPLLLALMYEYNKPSSKWRHYFDICLHLGEEDLPMFWTEERNVSLLAGTGVSDAVTRDLSNMENDYSKIIKPFISKHCQLFDLKSNSFKFFKSMVAFVMAYSFTEPAADEDGVPSPPVMVPMADILNHVAKNNANLEFEKDYLKMVAISNIKKGQEVYNTYGPSSNSSLLHMYGFAEEYPLNHYDTVDIPIHMTLDASVDLGINSVTLLQEKKIFMENMDLLSDDVVIGTEGVVYPDDMTSILKVLTMSKSEFNEYKEKDGWSSSEENEQMEEDSLLFKNMKRCPNNWKMLLSRCGKKCLENYSPCLDKDEDFTATVLCNSRRFALYTCNGQKKILNLLIDSCEHV